MSLQSKILIILGSILTIGLLSFIVFKQIEISNRQIAIEQSVVKQKDLIDGIVRSQSEYATKGDVEKFIKDNGVNFKAIQDDLKKLRADVVAANVIVVHSGGQIGSNIPSSGTGTKNPTIPDVIICNGTELTCPNTDPFGYRKLEQKLTLSEDFSGTKVPFGEVGFSAWQKDPWSININPREYDVVSVVGTDENQRHYFYNKFTLKVDDKSYDVKIASATTKEVYPEAKFSWWNPRLLIGVDAGVNITSIKGSFGPSLSLGLMSYGRYLTNPDFSVLELGVGYEAVSQRPQVVITPFAYNIGKRIPFMSNTYIGPSLQISTAGDISAGGSIRVGL